MTQKAEQLKIELMDMDKRREDLEKQLADHQCVLDTNKIGMTEPLVDKDDFPRNDIDVYSVRNARSHIVRLENDAKSLFNEIGLKLIELHEELDKIKETKDTCQSSQ